MSIQLPNITCVLPSSSEASKKFWGTTLPFIYSCNQQEYTKICPINGIMGISQCSLYLLPCSSTGRGTHFSHAGQCWGHCGCSGFTRVFLTVRYKMFIMLLMHVIHAESAHQLNFGGEVLVHEKFPFLRKNPLSFSSFLPLFFGSLECYCFQLRG